MLSASPDGRWLAVGGSAAGETSESSEIEILPLGPQTPGESPRRTRNLGWEETFSWAGKNLFVSVVGEEKEGRYTATEARLFRWDDEGRRLVLAEERHRGVRLPLEGLISGG